MIKLYNTLTRKKEDFKEIKKGLVKIYSCGPTVYSYQHIGNLRAAISWDFLKKMFRYFDYEILDVTNITDVGHLVSDEDEGEDKMLKASKKENKNPFEIAKYYEKVYTDDLKLLNIKLSKIMPKATEHIDEQIKMIENLEKRGFTYKTEDGVYFDVSKFDEYGKLSGQNLEEKQDGARLKNNFEKKNPMDFALWKFLTKDNLNHLMKWESPWGVGFPGWHLECSAMSNKYLGNEFDIHTGGIEHISIHHENEIAQNTCSGQIKKVNYWLHNNHLLVDSKKMSKSIGNVYLLSDLIKKGYNPLAFRDISIRTHYKKQMNFTIENLDAGMKNLERYNEFYNKLNLKNPVENENKDLVKNIIIEKKEKFENAIKDDLNLPLSIVIFEEFMTQINKIEKLNKSEINDIKEFFEKVDSIYCLLEKKENEDIPNEILDLIEKRKIAKENNNWNKADEIRDEIKELGFLIKDNKNLKNGYSISKIQ